MGVRIAIKTFTNPWLYVYCSDFCITALIAFFRIVKRFSSSEAQIWFSVVRNTQEKVKKRKDFIQTFWSLWSFAFEKLKITMIKKFRWNVFAFWYFTEIFLMIEQSNLGFTGSKPFYCTKKARSFYCSEGKTIHKRSVEGNSCLLFDEYSLEKIHIWHTEKPFMCY